MVGAHCNFAESKTFDLVWASCAPVNLRHESLPEAHDNIGFWERPLLDNSSHCRDGL